MNANRVPLRLPTFAILALALMVGTASGLAVPGVAGQTAIQAKTPGSPDLVVWHLALDYTIDGKLEDNQKLQANSLQLRVRGSQLTGHFLDKRVRGENNESSFSGETVAREKTLLVLRQDHTNRDGRYAVIHTGHQVGVDHYRGTWHDNSGQSGDFELKIGK